MNSKQSGTSQQPRERLEERDLLQPILAICRQHNITLEELVSPSKMRHIFRGRAHVCAYLHDDVGLSLPSIGALLNRDDASVLNAIRRWRGEPGRHHRPVVVHRLAPDGRPTMDLLHPPPSEVEPYFPPGTWSLDQEETVS